MNKNISKRLFNDLFVKRSVTLGNIYYRKNFNIIWPCEQLFTKFLKSSDTSVKLSYAKKIYSFFRANDSVVVPSYEFEELVKNQTFLLSNSEKQHLAQDHIIHSIYLYILEVYLLFNMKVFYKQFLLDVLNQFSYPAFISTIKKMQHFALYHDFGYVLESSFSSNSPYIKVELDNLVKDPEAKTKHIAYELTSKSVARIITSATIIHNCHDYFSSETLHMLVNQFGYDESQQSLEENLSTFYDALRIKHIDQFETFMTFFPFYKTSKYLVLCQDQLATPIALITSNNDQKEIIYNQNYHFHKAKSIEELLYDNTLLHTFFISNPFEMISDLFTSQDLISYKNQIDIFYSSLPERMIARFDFISGNQGVIQLYNAIYSWIISRTKSYYLNNQEQDIYHFSLSPYLIKEISNSFNYTIDITLKGSNIIPTDLDKTKRDLIKSIHTIDSNSIIDKAVKAYENDNGVSFEILNFHQRLYHSILAKILPSEIGEQTPLSILKNDSPTHNSFSLNILRTMAEKSNSLDLEWNTLLQYKPNHSSYDHGVISASLFLSALIINKKILEDNLKSPIIFSILLHNIYVKKESQPWGLEYKQNFGIQPFSYFCALCDFLQKWGRPKQIDQSVLNLPDNNFIENDYDIDVSNETIRIIYNTSLPGSMQKDIGSAEEYLPGISKLIKISEDEV